MDQPSFACGVCGKCFPSAERLSQHMQSHTGRRPFRCLICWPMFYHMPGAQVASTPEMSPLHMSVSPREMSPGEMSPQEMSPPHLSPQKMPLPASEEETLPYPPKGMSPFVPEETSPSVPSLAPVSASGDNASQVTSTRTKGVFAEEASSVETSSVELASMHIEDVSSTQAQEDDAMKNLEKVSDRLQHDLVESAAGTDNPETGAEVSGEKTSIVDEPPLDSVKPTADDDSPELIEGEPLESEAEDVAVNPSQSPDGAPVDAAAKDSGDLETSMDSSATIDWAENGPKGEDLVENVYLSAEVDPEPSAQETNIANNKTDKEQSANVKGEAIVGKRNRRKSPRGKDKVAANDRDVEPSSNVEEDFASKRDEEQQSGSVEEEDVDKRGVRKSPRKRDTDHSPDVKSNVATKKGGRKSTSAANKLFASKESRKSSPDFREKAVNQRGGRKEESVLYKVLVADESDEAQSASMRDKAVANEKSGEQLDNVRQKVAPEKKAEKQPSSVRNKDVNKRGMRKSDHAGNKMASPKRDLRSTDVLRKRDLRSTDVLPKRDLRSTDVLPKRDIRNADVSPKRDQRSTDVSPKRDQRSTDVSPKTDLRIADISPKRDLRRVDVLPKRDLRRTANAQEKGVTNKRGGIKSACGKEKVVANKRGGRKSAHLGDEVCTENGVQETGPAVDPYLAVQEKGVPESCRGESVNPPQTYRKEVRDEGTSTLIALDKEDAPPTNANETGSSVQVIEGTVKNKRDKRKRSSSPKKRSASAQTVEDPPQKSVDRSSQKSVDRSSQKSVDRSSQKSVDRSSQKSVDRSSQKSVDRSSQKSVDRSSQKCVEGSLSVESVVICRTLPDKSVIVIQDDGFEDFGGEQGEEMAKASNKTSESSVSAVTSKAQMPSEEAAHKAAAYEDTASENRMGVRDIGSETDIRSEDKVGPTDPDQSMSDNAETREPIIPPPWDPKRRTLSVPQNVRQVQYSLSASQDVRQVQYSFEDLIASAIFLNQGQAGVSTPEQSSRQQDSGFVPISSAEASHAAPHHTEGLRSDSGFVPISSAEASHAAPHHAEGLRCDSGRRKKGKPKKLSLDGSLPPYLAEKLRSRSSTPDSFGEPVTKSDYVAALDLCNQGNNQQHVGERDGDSDETKTGEQQVAAASKHNRHLGGPDHTYHKPVVSEPDDNCSKEKQSPDHENSDGNLAESDTHAEIEDAEDNSLVAEDLSAQSKTAERASSPSDSELTPMPSESQAAESAPEAGERKTENPASGGDKVKTLYAPTNFMGLISFLKNLNITSISRNGGPQTDASGENLSGELTPLRVGENIPEFDVAPCIPSTSQGPPQSPVEVNITQPYAGSDSSSLVKDIALNRGSVCIELRHKGVSVCLLKMPDSMLRTLLSGKTIDTNSTEVTYFESNSPTKAVNGSNNVPEQQVEDQDIGGSDRTSGEGKNPNNSETFQLSGQQFYLCELTGQLKLCSSQSGEKIASNGEGTNLSEAPASKESGEVQSTVPPKKQRRQQVIVAEIHANPFEAKADGEAHLKKQQESDYNSAKATGVECVKQVNVGKQGETDAQVVTADHSPQISTDHSENIRKKSPERKTRKHGLEICETEGSSGKHGNSADSSELKKPRMSSEKQMLTRSSPEKQTKTSEKVEVRKFMENQEIGESNDLRRSPRSPEKHPRISETVEKKKPRYAERLMISPKFPERQVRITEKGGSRKARSAERKTTQTSTENQMKISKKDEVRKSQRSPGKQTRISEAGENEKARSAERLVTAQRSPDKQVRITETGEVRKTRSAERLATDHSSERQINRTGTNEWKRPRSAERQITTQKSPAEVVKSTQRGDIRKSQGSTERQAAAKTDKVSTQKSPEEQLKSTQRGDIRKSQGSTERQAAAKTDKVGKSVEKQTGEMKKSTGNQGMIGETSESKKLRMSAEKHMIVEAGPAMTPRRSNSPEKQGKISHVAEGKKLKKSAEKSVTVSEKSSREDKEKTSQKDSGRIVPCEAVQTVKDSPVLTDVEKGDNLVKTAQKGGKSVKCLRKGDKSVKAAEVGDKENNSAESTDSSIEKQDNSAATVSHNEENSLKATSMEEWGSVSGKADWSEIKVVPAHVWDLIKEVTIPLIDCCPDGQLTPSIRVSECKESVENVHVPKINRPYPETQTPTSSRLYRKSRHAKTQQENAASVSRQEDLAWESHQEEDIVSMNGKEEEVASKSAEDFASTSQQDIAPQSGQEEFSALVLSGAFASHDESLPSGSGAIQLYNAGVDYSEQFSGQQLYFQLLPDVVYPAELLVNFGQVGATALSPVKTEAHDTSYDENNVQDFETSCDGSFDTTAINNAMVMPPQSPLIFTPSIAESVKRATTTVSHQMQMPPPSPLIFTPSIAESVKRTTSKRKLALETNEGDNAKDISEERTAKKTKTLSEILNARNVQTQKKTKKLVEKSDARTSVTQKKKKSSETFCVTNSQTEKAKQVLRRKQNLSGAKEKKKSATNTSKDNALVQDDSDSADVEERQEDKPGPGEKELPKRTCKKRQIKGNTLLHTCSECGAMFRKYLKYVSHLAYGCKQRFDCHICGSSLGRRESLKIHMTIHTGEASVSCHICGKKLAGRHSLVNHMRIHTGEKPYKCGQCGKTFRHSSALVSHKRTHTNDPIFKCDICDRTYRFRKSLHNHRLSHTGERPYKCDVCGAAYFQSGALNNHMKSHSFERPFPCPFCSARFAQKESLDKHVREVHPYKVREVEYRKAKEEGKPHLCSMCNRGFNSLSSMQRHMKSFCFMIKKERA